MGEMLTRRTAILAAAAGLLARSTPALAQARFQAPEVESLTVDILVDAQAFAFAEPVDRPDLKVTRAPRSFADYRRTLLSEFGLSLLARTRRGDEARSILVDFGYTPQALLNNMELMGVDPATIDAAVLSHGHYDHFGGLDGLLATGRMRRGAPFYVGGEEAFCARDRLGGLGVPISDFGALDRSAILAAGLRIVSSPEPQVVAGHGFTTGEIPLVTAERPTIPTQMHVGEGCARAGLNPAKRDAGVLPDDGEHEIGTAFLVKDRGLVVIGSCSHRGILNTIRRAQAVSGVEKLHAVIGGFHLVSPRTPDEARATVPALKALNPDYIVPGHCTGEVFIQEAIAQMPGKVIRPYVGSRFTFGTRV